jgi:glucokinase
MATKGEISKMVSGPSKMVPSMKFSEIDIYPQILKKLYQNDEVLLSQLTNDLGIEMTSIKPALLTLVKSGFVRWDRKPGIPIEDTRITLRDDKIYFIGVDLGGTKLYGGIANLAGKILFDIEVRHNGKSGEACYEMLVEVLDSLLEKAKLEGYGIRGIGIQVPGLVQLETGLVLRAPGVGWEQFPLKERLASKYEIPVFVDNDLKQSALGEAWFGAGKFSSNVTLVAIGTGIAAAVVANDVLQRGAHLRHGEVGWMVPGREFLGRRYKGFGALEVEASGTGIARRARELLDGKLSEDELASLTSEDVFNAARKGEVWAAEVISETVEYLAILIANIMAFYDPDTIILSGGVSRSQDLLIEPILNLIEGCVPIQPNIVYSSLGYQAGVLGAVVNLLLSCPEIYSNSSR